MAEIQRAMQTLAGMLGDKFSTKDLAEMGPMEILTRVQASNLNMELDSLDGGPSRCFLRFDIDESSGQGMKKQSFANMIEAAEAEGLRATDDLVLVVRNPPASPVAGRIREIYESKGIYVVIWTLADLQFDRAQSCLWVPASIASSDETEKLGDPNKLPRIYQDDPAAKYYRARPGTILRFNRNSPTAAIAPYYRRVVVADI